MPRAALKTSRNVGDLLRRKRSEMGLTLREVSERLRESGDPIPTSTLARIERGKLDPGVRRLHHLLRLYNVPPHLVADLVEMEESAQELPAVVDLAQSLKEGVEALRQGNIAKGLAHLFAVRQHVPGDDASRILRQRATLGFAIAARNQGKHRLARQIVDDLLVEPPDPSLLVSILVLASTVWQGLGSIHAASAFIHEAARSQLPDDDPLTSAWILHQKAKVLVASGDLSGADHAIAGAIDCYRKRGDTYGEGRALLSRIEILESLGDLAGGAGSAERALSIAEAHGHGQLQALARIELGRLRVRAGDAEAGLESLRKALGEAILIGDRHAQFVAHFHLWKAHERLGDQDRARLELDAAMYFVRFVDDQSTESLEIHRRMQSKGSPS
jgi:transcriptional regulator with XRE-family HTH domain